MIKFNSTNIVVGEIKELLKSFNLPSYKVLVDNEPVSIFKGFNYIYNDMILVANVDKDFNDGFIYNSSDFVNRGTYFFGQDILNITHNLVIKNVNYDYLTHNRLGNYLRFIRDYKGINLMSMYNCYNGQSANNIDISVLDNDNKPIFTFDTTDVSYKLLTIPVKYRKKYSFYVDCPTNLEIVACFYLNNNQLNDLVVGTTSKVLESHLYPNTHMKINGTRFNTPFVYDKLENLLFNLSGDIKKTFAQKELELTLLLKLPKDNNSSVVVLEGDYSQDVTQRCLTSNTFSSHTQYIYNYENINKYISNFDKYQSYKQLTYLNDNNSYPFSIRLLEYLIGNVITPIDEITLDTKRVEANLIKKKIIDSYTPYYD